MLKVVAIRVNMGLSQEQMAKKLNMSVNTYRNKENGNTYWYFYEIKLISQLSGIKIEEIDA